MSNKEYKFNTDMGSDLAPLLECDEEPEMIFYLIETKPGDDVPDHIQKAYDLRSAVSMSFLKEEMSEEEYENLRVNILGLTPKEERENERKAD